LCGVSGMKEDFRDNGGTARDGRVDVDDLSS